MKEQRWQADLGVSLQELLWGVAPPPPKNHLGHCESKYLKIFGELLRSAKCALPRPKPFKSSHKLSVFIL